jgi:DNA processing protein
LPEAGWLLALVSLPGMGPARLDLVTTGRSPSEAWAHVLRGAQEVPAAVAERWRTIAAALDVPQLWAAHERAGVTVLDPTSPAWPAALLEDPEPPPLLFASGQAAVLAAPRVAIVGTRRCSFAGREVARELGADLAAEGICVVSGLALGIDGAAHAGALAAGGAPPAAVVATGVDVVYPRRHAELWRAVAERGVVLSEYPLGVWPERWRFPARNRIIAGLADVVVVVESHLRGGSMHTVESALERDRLVMAVPGSVRSPAAAGCNALLAAGSPPCRDAGDVLVALGLQQSAMRVPEPSADPLVEALGWEPVTLEQVADRLDAPLGPVAARLAELEAGGHVVQRGGWYERVR